MAIYRQNTTITTPPAAVDMTSVVRTTAAAVAGDAQNTAKILGVIGNTMWGAYVGKQQADLEKGLKEQVNNLAILSWV